MDLSYDVIIIGGGPAGLSAAIYASRANLKTLIIEADAPGGKLVKTYEIENYPGVRKSSGVDLAMSLMDHGLAFGATFEGGCVEKLINEPGKHTVVLTNGKQYEGKSVIIATGTKEKTLDVPESEKYTGHGISYCAVCDGAFYRDKNVCVIGGGNSALEESLYLTSLVNKVNIIIRRDVFRAEANIVERVKNNDKINIIVKHIPKSLVIKDNKIVGLEIENVDTKESSIVDCEGIFPYIGADASTSFCPSEILTDKGYIIVDNNMATSIEGVYGAGDVIDKQLRQVVTATNDGAIAANSIIKYLKEREK